MMTMRKAVSGILIHEDKILIGKKIEKEGHFCSGGWHIPGGYIKGVEDELTALKREFKEETNLEIEMINKLTSIKIIKNDMEVHWYICKALTFDLIPGDDLEDAKFVDKDKVVEFCDTRATRLWPQQVLEYLKKH